MPASLAPLACVEPSPLARRGDLGGLDLGDTGRRRPHPKAALEAHHGLGLPFGDHLDRPIGPIGHPACHALVARDALGEHAEPDAVDAARNHVTTADHDAEEYMPSDRRQ